MINLENDDLVGGVDSELEDAITLFEEVGSPIRNMEEYGRWLYYVFENSCLSSVDSDYESLIALDKTKLTLFVTLLDDIADDYRIRDEDLLRKGVMIPYSESSDYSSDYLRVTDRIWSMFFDSVKDYPRFDEFRDLFFFDLDQFLDSIKYAFLSNEMNLDNYFEDERYLPHNFMVTVHGDIDLMYSKDFDVRDLSVLRPVLYWAQDILHIGNVIRTYPREVRQRDLSSPIIAMGLRRGVVDEDVIMNDPELAVEELESLIPIFEGRVDDRFERMEGKVGETETVNINEYIGKVKGVYNEIKSCKYSIPEDLAD